MGALVYTPALGEGLSRYSPFIPARYDTESLRDLTAKAGFSYPPPDIRLVVLKRERTLRFYSGDHLLKRYPVALGRDPMEAKQVEGDERTPEGVFYFVTRKDNGDRDGYFGFMGLSYPTAADAVRGYEDPDIRLNASVARRIIQAVQNRLTWAEWTTEKVGLWYLPKLGGEVGIHGGGLRLRKVDGVWALLDWTEGCIAMEDDDIAEIRDAAARSWKKVPVLIAKGANELEQGELKAPFRHFLERPKAYVSAGSLLPLQIPAALEEVFASQN